MLRGRFACLSGALWSTITALTTQIPAQLTWRQAGATMPARAGHCAFFDQPRGRVAVFAGQVTPTTYGNDCWELEDNEWMQIPAPALTARGHGAYCEDPTGPGNGIVFSGRRDNGSLTAETLRFDVQSLRWLTLSPVNFPPPRWISAMAYDSARGRAVLFGGGDATGALGDTWEWDGANWQQRIPVPSPPARANHAMAYDAARERVVLYGGHNGASLGDTWVFDGRSWIDVSPAGRSPGALHNLMLAYDENRRVVVLFGGKDDSGTVQDAIWEWDGTSWRGPNRPATRPPARELATLTYDTQRRCLVLVGGQGQGGALLGDAWRWDGASWMQLLPGGRGTLVEPAARGFPSLAYSEQSNKTILFGGYLRVGLSLFPLDDTWESAGRLWQRRTPTTHPPGSYNGAGTILRSTGEAYWFPGRDTLWNSYNEQWSWDGSQWNRVTLSGAPSTPLAHQVVASLQSPFYGWLFVRVLTSGTYPLFTSAVQLIQPFTGNTATISVPGGPIPRTGSVLVQSPSAAVASDKVWLFGGQGLTISGQTYFSDLWELADAGGGNFAWTSLAPASGSPIPPGRRDAAVAHDGGSLLFVMGGADASGPLADSWTFHLGTRVWTQIPGPGPSARSGAAMTMDLSIGRMVLLGGFDGANVLGDSWEFDNASWQQRMTPSVPAPRSRHAMVYDRANHRCLLFGGDASISPRTPQTTNQTWSYDGTTWSPLVGLGTSPWPAAGHVACFDESLGAMVLFGADTRVLSSTGAWSPANTTGPRPRVDSALVYVPSRQRCFLFGGNLGDELFPLPSGEAWTYDAGGDRWTAAPGGPAARYGHGMACDRLRDRVVLFGGYSGPQGGSLLDDTWEYSPASGWLQRTPAQRPSARYRHAMVYDEARGRTVLFGGDSGTAAGLDDLWEWDGTDWLQRAPETTLPSVRSGATALVYDPDRGRLTLFGGRDVGNPFPVAVDALWHLDAPIDVTGRGNAAQPEGLRCWSQPALGQVLRLGFSNPQGVALLQFATGPRQQPILQMGAPLCEAGSVYAIDFLEVVTGRVEPNVALPLPNDASLRGMVLVLQAFSYQAAGCLRATDALNVRFY